jgi:hypothetical protein
VVYDCYAHTQEAEVGESRIQGQPWLHNETLERERERENESKKGARGGLKGSGEEV